MDYGHSGATIAGHLVLCAALILVFVRAVALRFVEGSLYAVATSAHVRLSLIAAMALLIVERVYYVAARLLEPSGVDLWAAHPAPELLSLGCALAVWNVSLAAMNAAGSCRSGRCWRMHLCEGLLLILAYLTIAWVLW